MRKLFSLWIACLTLGLGFEPRAFAAARSQGSAHMAAGVSAFLENRLHDAMHEFLTVLRQDPGDRRAHAYVDLISRKLSQEHEQYADSRRLDILRAASYTLEMQNKSNTALNKVLSDSEETVTLRKESRWRRLIEEAGLQRGLGHLFSAYDLTLQVLTQHPSFVDAQRELGELQIVGSQRLAMENGLSASERFALQGYYAFAEANYADAVVAWRKSREIIEQTYPRKETAHHLTLMRFAEHEQTAQAYLDEQKRAADIKREFENAEQLFAHADYEKALDGFRRVAVANPEYPGLATYLIRAESAQEQDRIRRIGEEKQNRVSDSFKKGMMALEQAQYSEAEKYFSLVLKLDPDHRQAQSYLAMVQGEIQRRQDPKAAQAHYESGLIAYASGKLEEAQREWRITLRMNPSHEKAKRALEKVQRELLYTKTLP